MNEILAKIKDKKPKDNDKESIILSGDMINEYSAFVEDNPTLATFADKPELKALAHLIYDKVGKPESESKPLAFNQIPPFSRRVYYKMAKFIYDNFQMKKDSKFDKIQL